VKLENSGGAHENIFEKFVYSGFGSNGDVLSQGIRMFKREKEI